MKVSKHHKINFTIEKETDRKIPFLDLLIKRSDSSLDIEIYRKETFTGLGINFISQCYSNFKMNTFHTLFYRAYRLTSSYLEFHKEIEYLKAFFSNNGFPESIFYNKLKRFLDNIFKTDIDKPTYGPRKIDLYFRLPFFNNKMNDYLKTEICKIILKHYPQTRPCPIFYNNHKVKNYLNHKEKLPLKFQSMLVYQYNCPSCQLAYIGSSARSFFFRYNEHRGTSSRTDKPLVKPPHSSIRDHCHGRCSVSVKLQDFKLLKSCRYETELRIAESMLIKKHKPQINSDSSSFNLKIT